MKKDSYLPLGAALAAGAFFYYRAKKRDGESLPETSSKAPESAAPATSAPAAAEPAPPRFKGVVLAGDSLMVGTANALKVPNKKTTASVGAQVSTVPKQLREVPLKGFDSLIISGGINDLAAGLKAAEVMGRIEKAWQAGRDRGFRIAHFELTPTGFSTGPYKVSEAQRLELNKLLAERAKALGVTLLRTSDMADLADTTQLRAEFAAKDRLHMTPAGYEEMAKKALAWLEDVKA